MAFLLPLCQILETALPTGALADLTDLRSALGGGRIATARQFHEWMKQHVAEQLGPVDGRGVLSARRSLAPLYAGKEAREHTAHLAAALAPEVNPTRLLLRLLDGRLTFSKPDESARRASATAGKRYLRIASRLYPRSGLSLYDDWIRAGECYGHMAVVHGWMCAFFQQDDRTAVLTYMLANLQCCAQAAREEGIVSAAEARGLLRSMHADLDAQTEQLLEQPEQWSGREEVHSMVQWPRKVEAALVGLGQV